MQLVETHIINNKEIETLCINAKCLYNQSLYYLRQSLFHKIEKFTEYELTGLFAEFNEENFRLLHSATSQQIIKLLFKNWKSYWKSVKDWKTNPNKYLGKPKLPNYKKQTSIVIFTNGQAKLKKGFIHFPKMTNLQPLKTKVDNICQVRIILLPNTFKIEVVYEKETTNLNLNPDNILSLDLGLNNFITALDNVGNSPFIINGKILKSFNHWYNKKRAKLMSFVGDKGISNKIRQITHYRNCYIEDKLHKISRFIIDYAVKNTIGTIIIGNNKQWKTEINLGKKTNQKFVELPHSKLINKIQYKADLVNINVLIPEESYTSKCDALALELVQKHEVYLGKRKKRGLFQSSVGKLVNADVNGLINISRKVVGDSFAKMIIHSGLAFNPIKINIF